MISAQMLKIVYLQFVCLFVFVFLDSKHNMSVSVKINNL